VLWLGTRVFVSLDGRAWQNVTPRGIAAPASIDQVSFVGKAQGWLLASVCSSPGVVFRSSDAGRTWRTHPFHHRHSCAAGASFRLDALDGRRAWVVQDEPTASFASLYRTTDGGRSWRTIGKSLPDIGSVTFTDLRRGWLSGGRLFRTADGGRHWTQVPLPAPRGYAGDLLLVSGAVFFGRTGVVAGEYLGRRRVIGFYRTTNAGRSWRLVATLAGSAPFLFPQFSVRAVSSSTVWLFTAGAKPVASVTVDGGFHWRSHPLAQKLYAPVAISATVAAASDFRGSPYITRDGGRTWRPLKL
jgi:photosystem II stability/assembly factor-like uncharacterized protein